ncbi:MAG: isoprenylcysteine carboxylmethyltransferase family protein [Eubacterium sp.]|nr:isoprenylcysteine carboxylmethyltransferase family protein [Eubacterium sp.]
MPEEKKRPGRSMADRIKERENDREEDDYSDLEEGQLAPIVTKAVKTPMSTYGVGPLFGLIAIALTIAGIVFRDKWIFKSGIPDNQVLKYGYLGFGVVLILAGLVLYWKAVFGIRIDDYIGSGKLCTDGIYAWTRNPIYAGILFVCTGALFISGNVYMYAIPILLWILLTVLLKKTEEPDMFQRFGQEYGDYYANVNRVLPKPPHK